MEKILIFIPVYRCEKQLPRVLARIAALGADAALFSQVLIVDNRSPDGTREAVNSGEVSVRGLYGYVT